MPALNRYDGWKCLALLAMTLDHVGLYLFPEALWLRAVGRVAFFIFFFLLGVNPSTRLPVKLWLAALLMAGLQLLHQGDALPLNILFAAIACRTMLATCTHYRILQHYPRECFAACVVLHLPLIFLWEYGGVALMFALVGRLNADATHHSRRVTAALLLVSLCLYALFQQMGFGFAGFHTALMLALFALVAYGLFTENIWQPLHCPVWVAFPMRFMARHALEYYVLHVALLMALANVFQSPSM